jgi:hypothetical protein
VGLHIVMSEKGEKENAFAKALPFMRSPSTLQLDMRYLKYKFIVAVALAFHTWSLKCSIFSFAVFEYLQ